MDRLINMSQKAVRSITLFAVTLGKLRSLPRFLSPTTGDTALGLCSSQAVGTIKCESAVERIKCSREK